jgi:hypothetical protein
MVDALQHNVSRLEGDFKAAMGQYKVSHVLDPPLSDNFPKRNALIACAFFIAGLDARDRGSARSRATEGCTARRSIREADQACQGEDFPACSRPCASAHIHATCSVQSYAALQQEAATMKGQLATQEVRASVVCVLRLL